VESARGAVLKRYSYFAAQYRRLAKRRGDKKAIVAVAHSILVIAYHVLRDGQSYHELGGTYFDRVNTDRFTRYNTKPSGWPPWAMPCDLDGLVLASVVDQDHAVDALANALHRVPRRLGGVVRRHDEYQARARRRLRAMHRAR